MDRAPLLVQGVSKEAAPACDLENVRLKLTEMTTDQIARKFNSYDRDVMR